MTTNLRPCIEPMPQPYSTRYRFKVWLPGREYPILCDTIRIATSVVEENT